MANQWDGLSDAEREALEDDEDSIEAGLKELVAGADDDDDDDDDGSAGPDEAGASAVIDGGDVDDDDDDPEAGEEADEERLAASVQSFSIPTANIAALDQKIEQLQSERDQLEASYESGESELSYADHRARLRAIESQLMALSEERAEARTAQKLNAAYQAEWWRRETRQFMREALKKDGVDYAQDAKLMSEWDKAVRFLGSDPENADKDAQWFLAEAHEMVKARFKLGKAERPPAADKALARSRVDEALEARRRRAGEPGKTLARLPEAGSETESEGEFSYLDRLSGLALERALAKLTPEQQERYAVA
jgi:hypothetical protein